MEHARYEAMVEEAISIKRRTRRDQVQLMHLIKEAKDGDVLEKFCEDINLSLAAAGNYLAAYAKFIEDWGVIPGSGEGADDLIAEMWESVYDPTLDGRFGYGQVDRDGIDTAADDLGLRGPTKAYDIAKNPNSLKAAIIGDGRAASAALEGLLSRAQTDESIAIALRSMLRETPPPPRERPYRGKDDIVREALRDLDEATIRMSQVDVPQYFTSLVKDHTLINISRLQEVVTIMEGKEALADL